MQRASAWLTWTIPLPVLLSPTCHPRLETGEPIEAWCERLVTEAGVLLLPACVYNHEPTTLAGHFRLGLGRRSLPECLKHLGAWLQKQYGG